MHGPDFPGPFLISVTLEDGIRSSVVHVQKVKSDTPQIWGDCGPHSNGRNHTMFRKTLLAIAAAATMAVGIAATTAPAEARHRHHHFGGVFITIGGFHHGGHRHGHCHRAKVWHNHHWVWVKKCHSHRHHHGHH
jgi:hypothetical protein